MYNVTSDLTLVQRRDFSIDSPGWFTVSGLQGMWATLVGDKLFPATSLAEVTPLFPIWTESNRDKTVGWTKDVTNTKKLTVLFGKHFATTDQYQGSAPALGDSLEIAANTGKLVVGNTNVIAYCVKAPYTLSYFGSDTTVIDIYVL
jgi:hypothetical protein